MIANYLTCGRLFYLLPPAAGMTIGIDRFPADMPPLVERCMGMSMEAYTSQLATRTCEDTAAGISALDSLPEQT